MPLSTGQQAILFTIALTLVGVGAFGTADTLHQYGLPPIVGLFFLIGGIIGTALIKAYGLGQQVSLKAQLKK